MVIVLAFERFVSIVPRPQAPRGRGPSCGTRRKGKDEGKGVRAPFPIPLVILALVLLSLALLPPPPPLFHHNSLSAARPAPVLEAALQAHAAALPPQVLSTRAHTPQPPPRHTPRRANAYAFALIIRQTKPQSVPAGERTTHPNHHRTHPGARTRTHSPSLYGNAMPGRRSRTHSPSLYGRTYTFALIIRQCQADDAMPGRRSRRAHPRSHALLNRV